MNFPTLSVVITNYNHGKYIGGQLQAILEQSFKPIEIIVVDDGSTDNSRDIIQEFAQREPSIKLFTNGENRGLIFTLNRALDLASGDYVYATSFDDRVLPGLFQESIELLALCPDAALCCSLPAFLDDATGIIRCHKNWFHISPEPCYVPPEGFVSIAGPNGLWVAGHTCIAKRSYILEAGKHADELRWHSDWFLFHVLAFRYGFCYIPAPLSALRIISTSYSAVGRRDVVAQSKVIKALIWLLKSEPYQDVKPFFRNSYLFDFLTITERLSVISSETHNESR